MAQPKSKVPESIVVHVTAEAYSYLYEKLFGHEQEHEWIIIPLAGGQKLHILPRDPAPPPTPNPWQDNL